MTITNLRAWLADWLHRLGDEIQPPDLKPPKPVGGKALHFLPSGMSLGRPCYQVRSGKNAEMNVGRIEWSNQWRRARFKPDADAVFDQQCIAEIYACMREFK